MDRKTRLMEKGHFRITDTETDSRVATCYSEENAVMVVEALNMQDGLKKTMDKIDESHRSQ